MGSNIFKSLLSDYTAFIPAHNSNYMHYANSFLKISDWK